MKKIFLNDVVLHCQGNVIMGNLDTVLEDFSKDTRTLNKDDVYVGIKGNSFNGNNLYKEALEKGAIGCILDADTEIDKEYLKKYSDRFIVLVENTIKALQDLASYKRSLYDIPVVAITGSVGKTSTKDIVASILGKKFNVLKTAENYNNHIGVPLTILSLKDHDLAVVEMGMNNLGEISLLSKIAKPTIGIITNVGTAHIGNLGSRENILKAKLEILEGMPVKRLIINNDNDLLHGYYLENSEDKIMTFGIDNKSDYQAFDIKYEVDKSIFKVLDEQDIEINIPGEHFVYNALCALTIGSYFDIPFKDIKAGIKEFILTKNRMDVLKVKDFTIIKDFYNANYDSMAAAINYLGSLKNHKIAVLGDMLELGEYSKNLHEKVGEVVYKNSIDNLVVVGKEAKYIASKAIELGFSKDDVFVCDSNLEAVSVLKNIITNDDVILLKASNGMEFVDIYNDLVNI